VLVDVYKEVVFEEVRGGDATISLGYAPKPLARTPTQQRARYDFPRSGWLQVAIAPRVSDFTSISVSLHTKSGAVRAYPCRLERTGCFALIDHVNLCDVVRSTLVVQIQSRGTGTRRIELRPQATYIVTERSKLGTLFHTSGQEKVRAKLTETPVCG
jgi:hypothetical protein